MAAVLSGAVLSPASALAQSPTANSGGGVWQATPKLNAVPTRSSDSHDAKRAGWNLAWQTPAVAKASAPSTVQQVGGTSDLRSRANPVRSAGYLQPAQRSGNGAVPVPVPDTNANAQRPAARAGANNFFENPFGDDRAVAQTPRHQTRQVAAQVEELFGDAPSRSANPVENPIADPTRPSANGVPNSLRGGQQDSGFGLPETLPSDTAGAATEMGLPSNRSDRLADPFQDDVPDESSAQQPPSSSDNIRDLMEDDSSSGLDTLPEPADADDDSNLLEENPFDRDDESSELEQLRRDLDLDRGRGGSDERSSPTFSGPDEGSKETDEGVSCDDFRKKVSADSIRNISLDPSPPLRPDVIDQEDFDEVRAEFLEKQSLRQWRAIDGTPLAVGYLRDLAYEHVIIETEYGGVEDLPKERLSEADLAYLTDNWGLPKECLLEQVAYQPRRWRPMTMTWKASNLCHKPLYFEEVNLERYGHTAGPILQPVVSSAHFFANIAVLPYKMGVHSPHECQYALGYYRPGNCAPWIIPPMPISARGAAFQTAAMVGGAWLIP